MIFVTEYETEIIGTLTLTSDGTALTGCWFENGRHNWRTTDDEVLHCNELEVFQLARDWLDRYFAGAAPNPHELPLHAFGTAFQLKVWKHLAEISYGQTVTYADIARKLEAESGKRMAAQAVGGAVGRNPLGVIVPCHRVMGANGNLTGFGGGIERKLALLSHEGIDTSSFRIPAERSSANMHTGAKDK